MDPSSTYALVIGINEYQCPDYPVLNAAVNDADAVDGYLKTTLNIPEENIISIRNTQASRQGILDGFQELENVATNGKQPCIIIFYAGHGARTERPLQWQDWAPESEFVEMLCPFDIGTERKDGEGVIEGIPDRTVCYLLNRLSIKRGNNITLILDCCSSAGLNRGSGQETARTILNPPPLSGKADLHVAIPEELTKQDESTSTRGIRPSPGFGGKFQDSHVLLAACGREQLAYEKDGRGMFTTALLSTLEGVKLQTTTYASLMDRLRMPAKQTPHCEGSYMDRPLFDRGEMRSDPSFISGKRFKKDGKGELVVSIDAGIAQGITLGELFSIHEDNLFETASRPNESIGILRAVTVDSFNTSLGHPPGYRKAKIPRNFYARRIDWRNDPPKVYCEDRTWLESVFPQNSTQQIDIVGNPADAALRLVRDGNQVHFHRGDPSLNQYIPERFSHSFECITTADIQRIIRAWQHFNYHLNRRGKNEFAQVRMELHYLELIDLEDSESSYEPENYRPKGENLLAKEPSEVRVPEADVEKPIGVTLYNDSDIPIYPYLFYFDPNNLTITPWFTAPHGAGLGDVDAPLPPHSKLPVGYANGATYPWQFSFEDDRDKDIGFFKLFLSASPANFSCIAQTESPFKEISTRGEDIPKDTMQAAQVEQLDKLDKDSWGVKAATIIQLRE